jgi:ACS family tartrate transporter-like MFS transporter
MTTVALASPLAPAQAAVARARRRLIPFLFLSYVVAYLDRVNIGFAAKSLQRDLALSENEYGLAAGLFFVGYLLLEIPSNLILARIGARVWISRIMVTWGACMGCASCSAPRRPASSQASSCT